jgi:hypothetical protein
MHYQRWRVYGDPLKRTKLPNNSQARWTKSEWSYVLNHCETTPINEIAKKLNRSTRSIFNKAHWEGVKLSQGTYSMQQVINKTGYSYDIIQKIIRKLHMPTRYHGTPKPHSRRKITHDEYERIVEELKRMYLKNYQPQDEK